MVEMSCVSKSKHYAWRLILVFISYFLDYLENCEEQRLSFNFDNSVMDLFCCNNTVSNVQDIFRRSKDTI